MYRIVQAPLLLQVHFTIKVVQIFKKKKACEVKDVLMNCGNHFSQSIIKLHITKKTRYTT